MAFEVGKRVVAESESTDRRPRSGVVEQVLTKGRPVASLPDPLGRRPREHLHARQRCPPGRTTAQRAAASGITETLTNLRRDDPLRPATDQTPSAQPTPRSRTAPVEADRNGLYWTFGDWRFGRGPPPPAAPIAKTAKTAKMSVTLSHAPSP
jgi:hypothetical protein